jgi:hypothetical protein
VVLGVLGFGIPALLLLVILAYGARDGVVQTLVWVSSLWGFVSNDGDNCGTNKRAAAGVVGPLGGRAVGWWCRSVREEIRFAVGAWRA